jgi:hypothetical protein
MLWGKILTGKSRFHVDVERVKVLGVFITGACHRVGECANPLIIGIAAFGGKGPEITNVSIIVNTCSSRKNCGGTSGGESDSAGEGGCKVHLEQ